MWEHTYFQMDIYKSPCHARCDGLILLETYTTHSGEEVSGKLPPFLDIKRNVTGDPAYSMYNLSLKSDWSTATLNSKSNDHPRRCSQNSINAHGSSHHPAN